MGDKTTLDPVGVCRIKNRSRLSYGQMMTGGKSESKLEQAHRGHTQAQEQRGRAGIMQTVVTSQCPSGVDLQDLDNID